MDLLLIDERDGPNEQGLTLPMEQEEVGTERGNGNTDHQLERDKEVSNTEVEEGENGAEEEEGEESSVSERNMDAAAARRKYERDNEFLLTFQARQRRQEEATRPNSKPNSIPFPIPQSNTPSPDDRGDSTGIAGDDNAGYGSRVQLMKEQWEKGIPLQLPDFNEPRLVLGDEKEGGASVVGVAKETPVGEGVKEGRGGGGGREGKLEEKRGGGGKSGEGGGGGNDGANNGRGSGGGEEGSGGDDRKPNKDQSDESEEEIEEEEEEEEEDGEERDLQGFSSRTPLLQSSRQRRPSSHSDDHWDSESSADDPLPPPPLLRSTLLTSSPLLTPSHRLAYHTLTNTRSAEEERRENEGTTGEDENNRSSATITPKSHDPKVESHDQSCDISAAHRFVLHSVKLKSVRVHLASFEFSLLTCPQLHL